MLGLRFVLQSFVSSFAIISLGKRDLADLLLFCSDWHVTAIVLSLFLAMPLVGLSFVIVPFPDPEVIQLYPCSTQLSMKFQRLIIIKMLKNKDFFTCLFIMLINVKMPTIVKLSMKKV